MSFRSFEPYKILLFVIGGVLLAAVLAFLFGFIVMLLWNWLMPDLFGLKTITYWQGWGLVLLAHILFKLGPGGRSYGHHDRGSRKSGHPGEAWKEKFRQRFAAKEVSPESQTGTPGGGDSPTV